MGLIRRRTYRDVRLHPCKWDFDYLHLRDLREGLVRTLQRPTGVWLDYGTQTSPYQDFLAHAELETADLVGSETPIEPTYRFAAGQPCPAATGRFHGILSTQVLEHVSVPRDYLQDCARMLRTGGILVLTTHGIWEYHPCPHDYHRWTAEGLRNEINPLPFVVEEIIPLTCGLRAVATLGLMVIAGNRRRPDGSKRWAVIIIGRVLALLINSMASLLLDSKSMGREESDRLYIGLLVVARRV